MSKVKYWLRRLCVGCKTNLQTKITALISNIDIGERGGRGAGRKNETLPSKVKYWLRRLSVGPRVDEICNVVSAFGSDRTDQSLQLATDVQTDGRTDGRTHEQADGQTDGDGQADRRCGKHADLTF